MSFDDPLVPSSGIVDDAGEIRLSLRSIAAKLARRLQVQMELFLIENEYSPLHHQYAYWDEETTGGARERVIVLVPRHVDLSRLDQADVRRILVESYPNRRIPWGVKF